MSSAQITIQLLVNVTLQVHESEYDKEEIANRYEEGLTDLIAEEGMEVVVDGSTLQLSEASVTVVNILPTAFEY